MNTKEILAKHAREQFAKFFGKTPDATLAVLEKLPEHYRTTVFGDKEAYCDLCKVVDGSVAIDAPMAYHNCPECAGWVPGLAAFRSVDNLNPRARAGRRGTEYFCKRCGEQIGFEGVMS